MTIVITATNFELTEALRAFIDEKFGSLERMLERWDKESPLELKVEVARTTKHHRHGDVFYAEVSLALPRELIRVQETAEDLHKAVDLVKDVLHERIKKYKEIQKA